MESDLRVRIPAWGQSLCMKTRCLPHAEREAIADGVANGNAPLFADSTLYVTLEPCSTSGKTPPCTDAILKHRFKRVVYGSEDPNPKHRGAAADILEQAGIKVTRGVL